MAGWVKRTEADVDTATSDLLATALSYSSASWSYLTELYQLAQRARGVGGCIVECGAQNGGSAVALGAGIGGVRTVWLFDNFTGVPKPALEDGAKAMQRWTVSQPNGWAKGDKAAAREALKTAGIKGKVIEGEFAETFASSAHRTGMIALLHIDATLYASTKLALERFYPQVAEGGLVILSAYHHWEGIRKAIGDFFGAKTPTLNTLEKGAWFIK